MRFHNLTGVVTGLMLLWTAGSAQAGPLLVAGSPGYDETSGIGLKDGYINPDVGRVNNRGTAVGISTRYINDEPYGPRAVRWDASGAAAIEMPALSTDSIGYTTSNAKTISDAGVVVGWSEKFVNGTSKGFRPVRWDVGGMATELGHLGTNSSGVTWAFAMVANNAGTIVGTVHRYSANNSVLGPRPVRWDASGTTAIELDYLGTSSSGWAEAWPHLINDSGTAAGYSNKYVSGVSKGTRAVRWDALTTAVTELGDLGTDSSGFTYCYAEAINATGTVVGHARRYVSGGNKGDRAVRWNAGTTAAIELGNLGADSSGVTNAYASAVNDLGTVVGWADKYVGNISKGRRAVRWNALSTTATELGTLGTDSSGGTQACAHVVNDAGTAVGYSQKYVNNLLVGDRAVLWLPNASAIDLNDLGVMPVTGGGTWTLTEANAISSDGYVAGEGTFDPDGAGPLAVYNRLWVAQVGLGGTWTGGAATNVWGRGPNWSTGTPAMQVGNATFDRNAAYRVTLDRDERTKIISVTAGTLTLDGNGHTLTTESGLNVAAGATLKPAGAIVGNVANAGTLSPGESLGSSSFSSSIGDEGPMSLFMGGPAASLSITGNLTNTGVLEFEIASPQFYDHLDLLGTLTAGGTIAVKLLDGYAPTAGATFDLLDANQFADSGYALDLSAASLPSGLSWDTSALATTGTISVVPEPTTLMLLACGTLAALLWWRRRQWPTRPFHDIVAYLPRHERS